MRAGLDLVVCDLRPEATAPFAASAHVAGTPADLGSPGRRGRGGRGQRPPGPGRARRGRRRRWRGLAPGSTVVVLSTVAPATVEAVRRPGVERRDVDVIDCGVSGGPQASADGTLVAMVGGDAAVIERVRPVLDAFTSLVVHMGPLGCRAQGQAGAQPRAVRVVAGRLRGPGAGRGGRDRAGQAGRGHPGERQVDRRGVAAHVPRHRRPAAARHPSRHRRRHGRRRRAWPTRTCRPPSSWAGPSASTCPWPR